MNHTLEVIAALFSLTYVLLSAFQFNLCWILAIFSSLMYVYIYYQAKLYQESALEIFFIISSVYGLYKWNYSKSKPIMPRESRARFKIFVIVLAFILTIIVGKLSDQFTDSVQPMYESFILVASIGNTFLSAHKFVESWIYWILIDLLASNLYFNRSLYATSILYLIYTILSLVGLIRWKKLIDTESKLINKD